MKKAYWNLQGWVSLATTLYCRVQPIDTPISSQRIHTQGKFKNYPYCHIILHMIYPLKLTDYKNNCADNSYVAQFLIFSSVLFCFQSGCIFLSVLTFLLSDLKLASQLAMFSTYSNYEARLRPSKAKSKLVYKLRRCFTTV